jgi:hypothetical protein
MKKKNKNKPKIVYLEDDGRTLYSMAGLDGRTPEEQEELEKKRKNAVFVTGKEKRAMIAAAFTVYGPFFLCMIGAFTLAALLMYFFLR